MNFFRNRRIMIIIVLVFTFLSTSTIIAGNLDSDLESRSENSEDLKSGVEVINMRVYEIDGIEMVQLRDLAEEQDWTLAYREENKEIIIRANGKLARYTLENGKQSIDKKDGPYLIEGRSYFSVESLSSLFAELDESIEFLATLYTDNTYYTIGDTIEAHIRLYNLSDEDMNLSFSSGQKYDLALEKEGEEIWRWSEEKFFTMAIVDLVLEPGESIEHDVEIDYDFTEPGEYILSGKLTTVNNPIELDELELIIEK